MAKVLLINGSPNMAWMIHKLNVSEDGHPEVESPLRTNFIR